MQIETSRVFSYRLPLKAEWHSAQGDFSTRSGCLLCLETDTGLRGWGDCASLTGDAAPDALSQWHKDLPGLDLAQARRHLEQSTLAPAARCAVDTALADLAAQQAGLPLACWLNPQAALNVQCNAALGALDETAAARAAAALAEGFTVLKLKVGLAGVAQELAWLRQLADALPAGILLRLDANQAWSEGDAQRFIAGLDGLPVEMLEEPLARPDLPRLAALQQRTAIALALDESLPGLDPAQVCASRAVRRLVLKPALLGGLYACMDWARQAQATQGMACVATTTLDCAVGTLAAAHLAAALGNGLHHGLATSAWLARDVGRAPPVSGGIMRLGTQPGLGFEPDWDELS
ncbi:hydrophobic dipeptide epimerase [Sulfurimicrobium lacus]|uniref:o-succinylbenzoate synthase n=1 Tax=Sulfurimicrobium lacus TaxID=2715678 RepID=A0A6F8VAS7_9PROT|nr:o-succinylbenzoate synthase [Sulfurimicrobium lacus]BCB26251.1 hydrophobic dipeptide epimerase [Sulfurimicrobium lacus]